MPGGTSPQALNALVSALVPFKPQTSPKQQEHVLHKGYIRITSMDWSPRQIILKSVAYEDEIFKKKMEKKKGTSPGKSTVS